MDKVHAASHVRHIAALFCISNLTNHVIDISGHMLGIYVYMPIFSDNLSWIHNIYIYIKYPKACNSFPNNPLHTLIQSVIN